MAQGLGLDEVVNISTDIRSGGIGPAEFGAGLLLVNDGTLSAAPEGGKIRRFASYRDVTATFTNATIRNEAAIWFSVDPDPKALYIARMVQAAVPTEVWSRPLVAEDLAAFKSATSGALSIQGVSIHSVNFAGDTTWSNIATRIQNAIQAVNSPTTLKTVEVSYQDSRLKFVLKGLNGKLLYAVPSFGTVNSGAFDIAAKLGLKGDEINLSEGASDDPGAYYRQGNAAESVLAALNEVITRASTGKPTNIMLSDTIANTALDEDGNAVTPNKHDSLHQFVSAGDFITAFVENGADTVFNSSGAIEVSNASKIGANAENNRSNVMGIYADPSASNTSNRRIDIAVLARLSAQDFNQPQSIITLVPKALNGVVTSEVTNSQLDALEASRGSVYTSLGGYSSFLGGRMGDGTWVDARYWMMWLKSTMEREIFNAVRQSNRLDNIALTDTIHKVMSKAINSGGVKLGGIVNSGIKQEIRNVTQNPSFDGVLRNGYMLWIQPYSAMSDIDRANRMQSFKVWVAPSEAIHSITGTIVLSG